MSSVTIVGAPSSSRKPASIRDFLPGSDHLSAGHAGMQEGQCWAPCRSATGMVDSANARGGSTNSDVVRTKVRVRTRAMKSNTGILRTFYCACLRCFVQSHSAGGTSGTCMPSGQEHSVEYYRSTQDVNLGGTVSSQSFDIFAVCTRRVLTTRKRTPPETTIQQNPWELYHPLSLSLPRS